MFYPKRIPEFGSQVLFGGFCVFGALCPCGACPPAAGAVPGPPPLKRMPVSGVHMFDMGGTGLGCWGSTVEPAQDWTCASAGGLCTACW